MSVPRSHAEESLKLTSDAEVDLYELTFPQTGVGVRFKNNNTVTWQGQIWEGIPCQLGGESYSADGQEARPVLTLVNPEGIFNEPVMDKLLYRATLVRKRVLLQHIESNANIYVQRTWFIERPKELVSGQMVSFELRSMTEGPNFQIPARMFIPPEFPNVAL